MEFLLFFIRLKVSYPTRENFATTSIGLWQQHTQKRINRIGNVVRGVCLAKEMRKAISLSPEPGVAS
jgi:hypothetical protein